MEPRPFGATDLRVSELGLGCARIGGIFQQSPASFVDLLETARDRGINFFDTADMYSQGESEALIGRAFRKRRTRVVIASKAGYLLPAQRRLAARIKPVLRPLIRALRLRRSTLSKGVAGALSQDFSPGYLTSAVEGSLRRLRTDYLDLLQLHSPPADVVERGDWIRSLEELKRAGKVRYYGVSVDTIEAGVAALRIPGVSALQCVVSLLERDRIPTLLAEARRKNVAVIARECLANGLLVKPADQIDLAAYCHSPEQVAARARELQDYRAQARAAGTSLTRYAIDFVREQPGVSVTLLGARTTEQLTGLLRAR